jgi:cytochrome c-type biogenesis protein CcmH/NrfG
VEARKRLLEAAGRQPENPEVWFRLAQLSQQLADTSGYQAAIRRFAQLDPKNPVTGALLAQALAIEAPANASATATGTPLPGAPLTAPAPPAAP